MSRVAVRFSFLLLVAGFALIFSGCPLPIDAGIAARLSDATLPEVVILSPRSGDAYSQTVALQLQINDSSGAAVGGISAIAVSVSTGLTSLVSEAVDPAGMDTDGLIGVDLALSTQDFSGPIIIRVTVTDWNDNRAEAQVTLDDPGNDIPSFVVIPGSEEVELSWQAVPDATSYTLFYSTNGTLPSETYGLKIDDITETYTEESPLLIGGLRNGSRHVFQLRANGGSDSSWYSGFVQVIPLSPLTLSPKVHAEYGQLVLEWQQIPGTSEFEVTRSTSADGEYTNVSGVVSGYAFVDEDAEIGTEYFYRVRPDVDGAIESAFSFGTPSPFVPATSRTIDFADTPGGAGRLEIVGSYAFVSDNLYNLQVVDISDPGDLQVVASLDIPGLWDWARDLVIQDDYLYLARSAYGIDIIDISNPVAPRVVSTFDVSDSAAYAHDVAVAGDFAFIGFQDYGIVVVDVSNPLTPTEVVDAGFPGSYTHIVVNGQYVYAVNRAVSFGSELDVFSMGDVDNPDLAYVGTETLEAGRAERLTVVGTRMFVSRTASLAGAVEVWDISTAADPARIGVVATPDDASAYDAFVAGDILYTAVASADHGVTAHDISDLANPRLLFSVPLPSGSLGIRLSGDVAYAGIGSFGLQSVDIALPPTPELRNPPNSFTSIKDLVVRSGYGFAANSSAGEPILDVFDLSNPAAPTRIASSAGTASGSGIVLRGDYAIVSGDPGLSVFDISNPLEPLLLGEYETPGDARDLDVLGDFAIVADANNGVQIVNVSDPTDLRYSQFVNTGQTYTVEIAGGRAYVGSGSPSGVHVVDLASPLQATRVGLYSGFSGTRIAAGLNHVAVASSETYGLVMLNTANPEIYVGIGDAGASQYIASYPPIEDSGGFFPTPEGVATNGGYAFEVDYPDESAPDEGDGLHVYDIADPVNARLLLDLDVFGRAVGVWTAGLRLYVLDWDLGLMVFDM